MRHGCELCELMGKDCNTIGCETAKVQAQVDKLFTEVGRAFHITWLSNWLLRRLTDRKIKRASRKKLANIKKVLRGLSNG